MAELADAHGSGPCGKPWGFESLRPHQNKKTSIGMFFCFHTKTGGIRTREGMSAIRMSGEHSNCEWSEGDRAGSRGGSLQARRSRRSDPFDRTTSQQTTLLSKTGFRPVFSCAPLLLLFPKKLTLFGDPDKKRWMSVCFHTKTGGIRTREGMGKHMGRQNRGAVSVPLNRRNLCKCSG